MSRTSGPALVKPVTVTIDGVTHHGTYYVQNSLVYVDYGDTKKATQVGGSPPASIARMLLSEMVREEFEGEIKY
jgi:hypothetical protein